jgi:hypothetical protein
MSASRHARRSSRLSYVSGLPSRSGHLRECYFVATGHKRWSLGSFDRHIGAVTDALLISTNDVGTGSNRDVSFQVTVEALGYFGET